MPAADLRTFPLEDAGTRTLTTRGVRFKKRDYVGSWMAGLAGIQVRVRFMPHHDHRIEVYHAATGLYLGPTDLADQATDEQISAVRRARASRVSSRAASGAGRRIRTPLMHRSPWSPAWTRHSVLTVVESAAAQQVTPARLAREIVEHPDLLTRATHRASARPSHLPANAPALSAAPSGTGANARKHRATTRC